MVPKVNFLTVKYFTCIIYNKLINEIYLINGKLNFK